MFVFDAPISENGQARFCRRLPVSRVLRPGLLLAAVGILLLLMGSAGCSSPEEAAPDFSLPAADGREVALAQLLSENHSVVLVFYRGFF
jgi:hypothetical protein